MDNQSSLSIHDESAFGLKIAEAFGLKRCPHGGLHEGMFKTEWGCRTPLGIYRMFQRIAEMIKLREVDRI